MPPRATSDPETIVKGRFTRPRKPSSMLCLPSRFLLLSPFLVIDGKRVSPLKGATRNMTIVNVQSSMRGDLKRSMPWLMSFNPG